MTQGRLKRSHEVPVPTGYFAILRTKDGDHVVDEDGLCELHLIDAIACEDWTGQMRHWCVECWIRYMWP